MDVCYIYGLVDPRTKTIRYVGKSKNPFTRAKNHLAEARMKSRRGGQRLVWLRELLTAGVEPDVVILECVHGMWAEREKTWIAAISGLLNGHPGGAGGWEHLTRAQRVRAGQKGGAAGKGTKCCKVFCEKQKRLGKLEGKARSERLQRGRKGSSKVAAHCRRIAQEREARKRLTHG